MLVIREGAEQLDGQAQARFATIGRLAAGAAHDFRNVMASIMLYAQSSLHTPDLPPKVGERLMAISTQAQQASELVQQILNLGRRAEVMHRQVDLVSLLQDLTQLLHRILPENIQLVLDRGTDEYVVQADPGQLQQAFVNLALNARDAMPSGGELRIGLRRVAWSPPLPEPLLTGSSAAVGPTVDWIEVTVADTGSGIQPEVLPSIFEPFFTTKAPGSGVGLGLTQVREAAELLGGYVEVQSQVGKGTAFRVCLPALPVEEPSAAQWTQDVILPARGETVLVVEDDPATRTALVHGLEALDYHALEAANGGDALRLMARGGGSIDLVLSDAVMPEMGGADLLRVLKRDFPAVKVVLLTGYPLGDKLRQLEAEGLDAWVEKPISLAKLSQVIAHTLGRGR